MVKDVVMERAARLRQARIAAGFKSAAEAAARFGWPYATYSQHERGQAGIPRAAADYAKAFKVSEAWLLTGEGGDETYPTVHLVGFAGAGPDGTVLFAEGDVYFGDVPAPVDATASTKALGVKGDSMRGVANDGWLIYYDDPIAPTEEHMGEPCVCWLEDGRVLVKTPYPGSGPGLFHLESVNAPMMRDMPVRSFALVTDIKPRAAAQKWLRMNPDAPVVDVKIA